MFNSIKVRKRHSGSLNESVICRPSKFELWKGYGGTQLFDTDFEKDGHDDFDEYEDNGRPNPERVGTHTPIHNNLLGLADRIENVFRLKGLTCTVSIQEDYAVDDKKDMEIVFMPHMRIVVIGGSINKIRKMVVSTVVSILDNTELIDKYTINMVSASSQCDDIDDVQVQCDSVTVDVSMRITDKMRKGGFFMAGTKDKMSKDTMIYKRNKYKETSVQDYI